MEMSLFYVLVLSMLNNGPHCQFIIDDVVSKLNGCSNTSKELNSRIVTKLEDHWNLPEVARHFNLSRTTVFYINKQWR